MRLNDIKHHLQEGISPILYHVTYMGNLRGILETDKFKLTPDIGTQADKNIGHKTKIYYLSTSRHKLGGYGLVVGNGSTNIVLDGIKLGQRYSGNPVDYWGPEFNAVNPRKAEAEDRIYSDNRFIPNATSYIKEVHMFIDVKRPDERIAIIRNWRGVLMALKKQGIPYWLYDDENAYLIQNKAKAIPMPTDPLTVKNKDDIKQKQWYRHRRNWLQPWVELYHKRTVAELSDTANDMRKRVIYDYDARDLLTSLKNDFHNHKTDDKSGVDTIISLMRREGLRTLDEFVELIAQKWKQKS